MFAVGKEFSSFDELKDAIDKYQLSTYSQFYVRDSRTIAATAKRAPKRRIKEDLKYGYLVYSCIAGGKKFQSKSTGSRPNQRTFRNDCPAEIKLAVGKNGQSLKVISVNENHNHECFEAAFIHLPQQRRISAVQTQEAVKLLEMRCNKKLVQNHLQKVTNKVITGRDIANIRHKFISSSKEKDNLQAIVEKLSENEGSTTEVIVDEQKNLIGIYYQDKTMKSSYSAYPELLCIDATYKLNNLRMPLYIMLGEDGMGESEIFASFLVANEEKETISRMIKIFKDTNSTWGKTVTIISDKDFSERDVLAKEFPNAKLQICLFHVLRSMRREITTDKMGITSEQRSLCLEIVQKMIYARTEEQYESYLESLKMTNIHSVIQYFMENWHINHHEWVEGLKCASLTFLNRTNNRLESLNQKLKEVCSKNATLSQFFDDFLIFLQSRKIARDQKACSILQKRAIKLYSTDTVEGAYMNILTPYAFGFVLQQVELQNKVKNIVRQGKGCYAVKSNGTQLNVTPTSCSCSFRSAMSLPCRHIFAVRNVEGMQLFDPSLCAARWSISYYRSKHYVARQDKSNLQCQISNSVKKRAILSQSEKYRLSFQASQKLASVISESPMREFEHKLDLLNNIIDCWSNGVEFSIRKHDDDLCIEQDAPVSPDADDFSLPHATEEVATSGNENYSKTDNYGTQTESPTCMTGIQHEESGEGCDVDIQLVKFPPVVRKRGRPKGSDLTVIGLPAKRRRNATSGCYKSRPVPFIKKHPLEKDKIMLNWLLSKKNVEKALQGELADETVVEVCPEKVHPGIVDENINLCRIRGYFTMDAWALVKQVVEKIKESPKWICNVCKDEVLEDCISCDSCLNWYHFDCTSLQKAPRAKFWFCRSCFSCSKFIV